MAVMGKRVAKGAAMDSAKIKAWWASLGLDTTEPPVDDDFGDMGTAFGLDATFRASESAPHEKGRTANDAPLPGTGLGKPRPA